MFDKYKNQIGFKLVSGLVPRNGLEKFSIFNSFEFDFAYFSLFLLLELKLVYRIKENST